MSDVLMHLTAGTIAGMTGVLVDYPLDTVKTRMQVRCHNTPKTYVQCARQLFQEGGVGAFYRGLSVPFAAQGTEAAIIFSVYNTSLKYFQAQSDATAHGEHSHGRAASPPASVLATPCYWKAAGCAGFAVSCVLTPVEMIKCNLQMESARPAWQRRHSTVRGFARHVYETDGPRGFYRGMTGTMMRAVLGNMAYFLSYEEGKRWLAQVSQTPSHSAKGKREADAAVPAWRSMVAGGVSGCLYWTVAYPADVAKTQMQVCPTAASNGFARTLAVLYRTGGVQALYRGWGVTAVRAFLSSGVVFTTYERCSRVLANVGAVHCTLQRDVAA